MKKLIAIFAILALAVAPGTALAFFSPDSSDSVSNSITTSSTITATGKVTTSSAVQTPMLYVVPAASTTLASGATAGEIKIISDSAAAGSCASDGAGGVGTTQVVCISDGTSWIAL